MVYIVVCITRVTLHLGLITLFELHSYLLASAAMHIPTSLHKALTSPSSGTEGVISGTSASCPLTSGIISLVNDALIVSRKPAVGFLNPCIYSKGLKGFIDAVNGSSHGCNTDGFPMAPGLDQVTRFGTFVS